MNGRRVSCVKRMMMGCGSIMLVWVLLLGGIGWRYWQDQPEPQEMVHKQISHSFPSNNKPIHLTLNLQACLEFEFKAAEQVNQSHMDVTYDMGNFDLDTHVEEQEDRIDYRISLTSTGPPWVYNAIFTGAQYDNRMQLTLPTNRLYTLEVMGETGAYQLDLTNLPVQSASFTCKKGDMRVINQEPNPETMAHLQLRSETGLIEVENLQNYRFSQCTIEAKAGKLALSSTGDFEPKHMAMEVDLWFANLHLALPPSAIALTDPASKIANTTQATPGSDQQVYTEIHIKDHLSFSSGNISTIGNP